MPDLIRPVVTHGAFTLPLGDFLKALKRSRRLRPLLLDTFIEAYLVDRARRAGLTINEKELQQAADNFRLRNGMSGAEQTKQWFQREAINEQDFASGLERDLLVEKLRRSVADPRVQEVFDKQAARFARVKMKRILVASEAEASEILDALNNNRLTFEEAARQKSLDLATRNAGGDAGITRRVDLAANIGDVVFQAEVGKVVGPLTAGQGFLLLQVEEFLPAELDENIRNGLRREIFDAWVRQELSRAAIEFPLLQSLSAG